MAVMNVERSASCTDVSSKKPELHRCYSGAHIESQERALDYEFGAACFEVKVTYHEHLFWSLQVDLYDARVILADAHVGRFELRLKDLQVDTKQKRWFELMPREINGELLALGLVEKPTHVIGCVEVCLEYSCISTSKIGAESRVELAEQVEKEQRIRRVSVGFALGTEDVGIDEQIIEPKTDGSVESEEEQDILDSSALLPGGDMLDRLIGVLLDPKDRLAVRSIRAIASGFGQGVEFGTLTLTMAFVLVQRFFALQPRLRDLF